jgi:hypothetical protein
LVFAQSYCLLVLHNELRREEAFANRVVWPMLRLSELATESQKGAHQEES